MSDVANRTVYNNTETGTNLVYNTWLDAAGRTVANWTTEAVPIPATGGSATIRNYPYFYINVTTQLFADKVQVNNFLSRLQVETK